MPRPRKHLRPGDYERIEAMASVGASMVTIAKRLGVAKRTFDAIRERDRRAREAFETGRGELESELVGSLYRQATREKNPNTVAGIFLLKSMCNFSDQPQARVEDSRVRIEVRLPAPLSEGQYRKLLNVNPSKALEEAVVDAE
jgi:hypothetical protein